MAKENAFYVELKKKIKKMRCNISFPCFCDPRVSTGSWDDLTREIKKRRKKARSKERRKEYARILVEITTCKKNLEAIPHRNNF